jgi:hypothetical protein
MLAAAFTPGHWPAESSRLSSRTSYVAPLSMRLRRASLPELNAS